MKDATRMRLMTDTPEQTALIERLAAIEHERWSAWQRWMHDQGVRHADGSLTLPAELVARWERQIATEYGDLPLFEQESDREQVARYWPVIAPFFCSDPPCHEQRAADKKR